MTADGDAIFLKNCWYVAAWDHELIDGAKLAHRFPWDASRAIASAACTTA